MTFKLNCSYLKWYFPPIHNEYPKYTTVDAAEVCSKVIISILQFLIVNTGSRFILVSLSSTLSITLLITVLLATTIICSSL